jgi:hypothetical protein
MLGSSSFLFSTRVDSSVQSSAHLDIATENSSLHLSPFAGRFADEYEFAVSDNWDGRGAKAVSRSVIALAERLINQFGGPRGTDYLVEIAPGRDGSLSFIWDDDRGNYIYLDFGPNDTVHLYYEPADEAKWEGVSVADDPRIIDQLRRAFTQLYPSQVVFRFERATTYPPAYISRPIGA